MITYKLDYPKNTSQLAIELNCYRYDHKIKDGGLGKLQHFKNAYALAYPHLISSYNSWTDLIVTNLVANDKVGGGTTSILGGSGTAKSFTVGHWALLDWMADPFNTITILSSTTLPDLNQRVWKYVKEAHSNLPETIRVGKLKLSKPEKIEERTGMMLTAALDNDPEGESLKGFHPPRLRIFVDEATAMTPAVMNLWNNWTASGKSFLLGSMSNFRGLDNLCAKLSEPIGGWNSVNYSTAQSWITELGSCVLLDLTKSPVYLNPALGAPDGPLKFLRSKKSVDETINKLGENHPRVLQYIRSIPSFDESAKTVLTLKQIERCQVFRKPTWAGFGRKRLLALDPAFTADGDEAILAPGLLGYESGGRQILHCEPLISLKLDAESKTPAEYQILEQVVSYAQIHNYSPEDFIIDATGSGRGIASIFKKEWSEDIHIVDAVCKASDRIVDVENNRTAHDLYDRIVTELWFRMRDFVDSMQVTGMDKAAAIQFCSRLYEQKVNARIKIEPKPLYKRRMYGLDAATGSPDQADACVYLLELAIRKGLVIDEKKGLFEERVVTSYESKAQQVVQDWLRTREEAAVEASGDVADDFTWDGAWEGIE